MYEKLQEYENAFTQYEQICVPEPWRCMWIDENKEKNDEMNVNKSLENDVCDVHGNNSNNDKMINYNNTLANQSGRYIYINSITNEVKGAELLQEIYTQHEQQQTNTTTNMIIDIDTSTQASTIGLIAASPEASPASTPPPPEPEPYDVNEDDTIIPPPPADISESQPQQKSNRATTETEREKREREIEAMETIEADSYQGPNIIESENVNKSSTTINMGNIHPSRLSINTSKSKSNKNSSGSGRLSSSEKIKKGSKNKDGSSGSGVIKVNNLKTKKNMSSLIGKWSKVRDELYKDS